MKQFLVRIEFYDRYDDGGSEMKIYKSKDLKTLCKEIFMKRFKPDAKELEEIAGNFKRCIENMSDGGDSYEIWEIKNDKLKQVL